MSKILISKMPTKFTIKQKNLKNNFFWGNNKTSNNEYNTETINYIKNNINNSSSTSHYYDENTKNQIEENSTLFLEIN